MENGNAIGMISIPNDIFQKIIENDVDIVLNRKKGIFKLVTRGTDNIICICSLNKKFVASEFCMIEPSGEISLSSNIKYQFSTVRNDKNFNILKEKIKESKSPSKLIEDFPITTQPQSIQKNPQPINKTRINHPQIVTQVINPINCLDLQINTFLDCIKSVEKNCYFPSIIDFAQDILKYTKHDEYYSQQRSKLQSLLSMCETDDNNYSESILDAIKDFHS